MEGLKVSVSVSVVFVLLDSFNNLGFVSGFCVNFCIIVLEMVNLVFIKIVVILCGKCIFWIIDILFFLVEEVSVNYIFFIEVFVVFNIIVIIKIRKNVIKFKISLYVKVIECGLLWFFVICFIFFLFIE